MGTILTHPLYVNDVPVTAVSKAVGVNSLRLRYEHADEGTDAYGGACGTVHFPMKSKVYEKKM